MFSEKLHEYLLEQPNMCDVTFSVGPNKERIRALRVVLVVASPAFRKLFEEKWDQSIVKTDEGIPLLDVDPSCFRIFLKLLPSEHVTILNLKKLKLTPDQIINLAYLSKTFGTDTMGNAFEEMCDDLIAQFDAFARTDDFLEVSSKNLAKILSSDNIATKEEEICRHVYRWAFHQCTKLGLIADQENLRIVLGECLEQIRFPLMSNKEFGSVISEREHTFLTQEEMLNIFRFIALDEEKKRSFDASTLGFKTTPRNRTIPTKKEISPTSDDLLSLRLFESPGFTSDPSFACDGRQLIAYFNVRTVVQLVGFGFPGPADCDAEYGVIFEMQKREHGILTKCWKTEHRVYAKQGQMFHILFDKPFICGPFDDPNRRFHYRFIYKLKGPNIQTVAKTSHQIGSAYEYLSKTHSTSNVTFAFGLMNKQIVEVLFRKL